MSELELYISSYFGIMEDDISKISSFFHLETIEKDRYFITEGKVCNRLSFLKSGLMRMFVVTRDKEITHWISTKGFFVTDLAGLIFQQPTRFTIQALTDCQLYTINQSAYNEIGKIIPKWHELEKLFIARCFLAMEDRILAHLSLNAEERFKLLMKQQPELFNQVPLQFLASMMGMTPETLSRIRKKTVD